MVKTQTRKTKRQSSSTISPIKGFSSSSRSSRRSSKSIKGKSSSLSDFQKEISATFLEMLLMVKLFHWKTTSYATHKATDELYLKLNANIDSFIKSF